MYVKPILKCTRGWQNCDVCPKGELEKWHKLGCLMGECAKCGVDKLSICFNEFFANGVWAVAWRCFEQDTIGFPYEGRSKKRIKKTFKETTTSMFMDYLWSKLQQFIKHNFVARCKIFNASWLWLTCLLISFYLTLTLPKITHSKSKMRSDLCISIHSKSQY